MSTKTEPDDLLQPDNPSKSGLLLGFTACLSATLIFASQDAITRHLAQTVPVPVITSVRFFFMMLFVLAYASRRTGVKQAFKSKHPVLQWTRGFLIFTESAIFAFALKFLGIAEMHTIFACFPLIVTALSVPLLGETVGWRRWLAVFVGFLGTIIILRPGMGIISPGILLGLLAALMFAVYNILTRRVSRSDSLETSLIYFSIFGFIASFAIIPIYWEPMSNSDIFWLGTITLTGIVGHLLFIKALQLAPVVILQPFNYFILVWAIILGYLIYGEVLDIYSIGGAILVVASGIFITLREYQIKPRKTPTFRAG